jgi:hypothetical protein
MLTGLSSSELKRAQDAVNDFSRAHVRERGFFERIFGSNPLNDEENALLKCMTLMFGPLSPKEARTVLNKWRKFPDFDWVGGDHADS